MSDIKFACPNCQQHIQADEGYGGQQISCPTCNASMIVPGAGPAPAPVPLQAPPPPPPPGPAPAYSRVAAAPAGSACPSCGGPITRSTVLCPKCGFNIATGKGLKPGAAAARMGAAVPGAQAKWYATPYPYLGVLVAVMAVLALMGKQHHPLLMLAFLGMGALYSFGVMIVVWIYAFKEDVKTGIFSFLFWPYALYFVYAKSESSLLKALVAVVVLFVASIYMLGATP